MDILSYDVPCKLFPRMEYAQRRSLDIYKRYNTFIRGFVMQDNEVAKYDHVSVHICKALTDTYFPVEIGDVIRQNDNLSPVKVATVENISTFLNEQSKRTITLSVIFLDARHLEKISKRMDASFLFVLLLRRPADVLKDESKTLIFSTQDCVRTDVCNMLEKNILKPMKEVCEFLIKVRTSQAGGIKGASGHSVYNTRANARKELKNEQAIESNEKFFNKDQEECNARTMRTRYTESVAYHHLMSRRNRKGAKDSTVQKQTTVNSIDAVEKNYMKKRNVECLDSIEEKSMKKKYRNVEDLQQFALSDSSFLESVDRAKVEELLEAMLALYGMSNVQENDQPQIPKHDTKELSNELCRNLFKINESIKGIGYHSGTLTVFVSEQDVNKQTKLRKQIGKFLSSFDIMDFETVQVSENVHNLMHIGAKLEPVPGYGTLGCFAKMDGRTNCILLSKHVATGCKEIYFEEKRKVCRILQETVKHKAGDLDIAAAEIFTDEGICETSFRDSTGKELKGNLHEYCGKDKLFTEEQTVHIWGASSKPGKGIITMPKIVLKCGECCQILVIIKDGDTKFAEEGDSGTVVCTDDPDGNCVYVLGMVMGKVLTNTGENNRMYYVLPLSEGLKQLARKTGKKFELI